MASAFIGLGFCLVPLVLVWLGYVWGRYGLPIEVRRRRMRDRRVTTEPAGTDEPVSVYRYEQETPS